METKTALVRKKDFIWREVDGETVVISSDNKLMHVLNETGSMIWSLLDENNDRDSIVQIVAAAFGGNEEAVRNDLDEFIETLKSLNLLEDCHGCL
jgi:hypothetical protein